ncbi:hypothetical protein Pflav_001070 [Phytohabitans flavus]|uniref:DUF4760 domain-containing protein n=1 Tax=Phytohabitans flavus TaxID=1076124 RepID=A0A6F8XIR5_9ACTN|nr:hypothetical protein Pflav_001070 [Phytohabitans flavus]
MAWFDSVKDLVGISLALLAVIVSLVTVLISRRREQASSYLAIQELMLSDEVQRGRLLIYQSGISGRIPPLGTADYFRIVRALSVFDLLGAYARKGIVRREWVLDYWHPRLQALRAGYELVNYREDGPYPNHGRPDLLDLIERAERYDCRRQCCTDGRRERRLSRGKAQTGIAREAELPNKAAPPPTA